MHTTTSIHHGPYESIPDTSSPGLQFLKRFLPALDSLTPSDETLRSLFTPNAPILAGSNPPMSAHRATPIMEVCGRHMSQSHHHVHIAWVIDLSNATAVSADVDADANLYAPLAGKIPMKRTVMFEAMSETIFKADPDQIPIKVRESNILDLGGRNEDDLQVVEMRIFFDSKPAQARAASLQMESAFGEAQREAG